MQDSLPAAGRISNNEKKQEHLRPCFSDADYSILFVNRKGSKEGEERIRPMCQKPIFFMLKFSVSVVGQRYTVTYPKENTTKTET